MTNHESSIKPIPELTRKEWKEAENPITITFPSTVQNPVRRQLGATISAYHNTIAAYVDPRHNLRATVQADRLMYLAAQQLENPIILLPNFEIGKPYEGGDSVFFPLPVTPDGNHILLYPHDLPITSTYARTVIQLARKHIEYRFDANNRLNVPISHRRLPDTSLFIVKPDTDKNRTASWYDSWPIGGIVNYPVRNFWEKYPVAGHFPHEFAHADIAYSFPQLYFTAINNNPCFDEMLAITQEWLLARISNIDYSGQPKSQRKLDNPYDQDAFPTNIINNSYFFTLNQYALSRHLGITTQGVDHYPQSTKPHLDRNAGRHVTTRESILNLVLQTINTQQEDLHHFKPGLKFYDLNQRHFDRPAYIGRTVLALFNLCINSAFENLLLINDKMSHLQQLLSPEGRQQLYAGIDLGYSLSFPRHNNQEWPYDMQRLLVNHSGHVDLFDTFNAYYASMVSRLINYNLCSFPQYKNRNAIISLAKSYAPSEYEQRDASEPQPPWPYTRRTEDIYTIARKAIIDKLLKDIFHQDQLAQYIEHLWQKNGQWFYDNTIAQMQPAVQLQNPPLRYSQIVETD